MNNTQPLTQRIGQAEKALQARQRTAVQKDSLVEKVSGALKSDAGTVLTMLNALMSRGFLTDSPESPGLVGPGSLLFWWRLQ